MTPDQFFRWIVRQERRHELIDGEPVMMAGANRRHDRIAAQTLRALGNRLEGRRCQPFTSDTAVRIPSGNIRYPDLGVDCGPFVDDAMEASEPTLVVEILSPSTRAFDLNEKLEEYRTVPTLAAILLIDPDRPQVRLHRREDARHWISERITGLEAEVTLSAIDVRLPLAELYAGLEFRPRPAVIDDA